MRITTAGIAERTPYRSRPDHPDMPARSLRPGELAAGLAAVAVVAQCALAPVTLVIAGLLVLVSRISRWPLAWLLLPAGGSACWLAVAGFPAAAHAVASGTGRLMSADLAVGLHPARLLHPAVAFGGTGRWLPEELPLLVLAGTAEAVMVLWPHRTPRPGVVAALRQRAARAALAAGHTVTASGFAMGVDCYSGRRAAVSWAQAEHGVLLTGGDPAELDEIGLAVACAAVRRRRAVLVLDLAAARATRDPAWRDARGAGVCSRVGLLAEHLGVPVTGAGAIADEAPAWPGGAGAVPGARDGGTHSLCGAFARAIRERSVVLVPARACEPAQYEPAQSEQALYEPARHAALSELVCTLARLRELGLRGDCLAWVAGCEAADAGQLSDLLSLGDATGTAVLLSTTTAGLAADLAADAGLVVASGPVTGNLAQRLADLVIGNSAIASRVGHGLRPSAPEPARGPGSANPAVADILRKQRRGSAAMIGDGTILGQGSFRIVPIKEAEVR